VQLCGEFGRDCTTGRRAQEWRPPSNNFIKSHSVRENVDFVCVSGVGKPFRGCPLGKFGDDSLGIITADENGIPIVDDVRFKIQTKDSIARSEV